MFHSVRQDLSFAVRTLAGCPAFTLTAILALALGIGANTTVFSVIATLINFPLPVDDPQRVVLVSSANVSEEIDESPVSVDDFLGWKERSRSFSHLAAGVSDDVHFMAGERPLRVPVFRITEGFFEAAGARLALGRTFTAEDTKPGANPVVILSHGLWQEHFGGDAGALGQTVLLNKRAVTIVGVAAAEFFFPRRTTLMWTPLTLRAGSAAREVRQLLVLGRLDEGVAIEAAQAEMEAIGKQLEESHPRANAGWSVRVETLRDNLVTGAWMALVILYAAISFVLLIACANVANLLLARAGVRQREMALRSSLGAGRLRLIRQMVTESLVLAGAGGFLGLLLGIWGIKALRNMLAPDPNVGFLAEFMHLNTAVLGHTLIVSMAAGVLFGLAPAIKISRSDLQSILKEGGRGAPQGGRPLLRGALVVAEVALALALLGAAGSLLRAFHHLYSLDPGFNEENLLTFQVSLPEEDYSEAEAREFFRKVRAELDLLPGVREATLSSLLPLSVFPGTLTTRVIPEGAGTDPLNSSPNALDIVVGEDHLGTLQIPILQGRSLNGSDRQDSPPAAVVSRALARRFWTEEGALGKRFKLRSGDQESEWITVVGVSGNLQSRAHSLRSPEPPAPTVFLSLSQRSRRRMFFLIRTEVAPSDFISTARAVLRRFDATLPLENPMSMRQAIARIDTQNRFFTRILSGLALLAVVLAGVGIYGLISYSVTQRRSEIGVRMALGAQPRKILTLVVSQAALLVLIGAALGVGLAYGLVSFLGSQLHGISVSNASGLGTYLAVCLLLGFVALLASLLPARRAIRLDPVEALRYE